MSAIDDITVFQKIGIDLSWSKYVIFVKVHQASRTVRIDGGAGAVQKKSQARPTETLDPMEHPPSILAYARKRP